MNISGHAAEQKLIRSKDGFAAEKLHLSELCMSHRSNAAQKPTCGGDIFQESFSEGGLCALLSSAGSRV